MGTNGQSVGQYFSQSLISWILWQTNHQSIFYYIINNQLISTVEATIVIMVSVIIHLLLSDLQSPSQLIKYIH